MSLCSKYVSLQGKTAIDSLIGVPVLGYMYMARVALHKQEVHACKCTGSFHVVLPQSNTCTCSCVHCGRSKAMNITYSLSHKYAL